MAKHYTFGKEAEKQAAKYLENKGYEILERNWRFHKLEIDLIALDSKSDETKDVARSNAERLASRRNNADRPKPSTPFVISIIRGSEPNVDVNTP